MNSTTISRAHGTPPFALVGALALTFAACGNESINVLTPREASVDVDTNDASEEMSVDASVDASLDAPSDPPSTVDGPALDTPMLDGPLADGPIVDAPTTGCLAVGQPCSAAGECCLLSCPLPSAGGQRTCAADPVCAPADQGCESNGACCSNFCVSNGCVGVTPPRCRPAGELCAANEDCCGVRCRPGAGGLTRCALLDGCRVLGEVCAKDSECCSGRGESDDNRRLCTAAPPCGIGGNTCRGQAGDRCAIDSDCCTGACMISGAEGPPRCATRACGNECAVCAEDRDCCIGLLCKVADESGYRRCE